jgi:DNA-binding LacI/PurR family transcriptional regulator
MQRSPRVGIRDVARHLNMSISTVSRALNGRPDSSSHTRERVQKAAAELGYYANHFGRSLRSGVTGTVGFVIQTSHSVTGQGDTFFMGVMDGMQSVLAPYQLDLVALLCPSTDDPDEYIRRIVSRGIVDGLVISHTRRIDPRIAFLASREVPFVALGRSQTDAGHPWIDIDFEDIARKSMHRFVARGHRRIAIAFPHEVNFSRIFRESAEQALAEHGLELDPELVFRSSAGDPGGYAIARRILELKDPPSAIAVANEAMTSGFYRGLLEAGRIPGRDIAVIGRDSPNTRYLSPRLTCFHLNLRDLGMAIGEALLSAMPAYRSDFPGGVVRRVFPTRFMQGESDNDKPPA